MIVCLHDVYHLFSFFQLSDHNGKLFHFVLVTLWGIHVFKMGGRGRGGGGGGFH